MKTYAIADFGAVPDEGEFLGRLSELCECGIDFIQLRAKNLEAATLMGLAASCRSLIPRGGPLFLINGRPDVASAAGADGVHLPSRGMPAAAARAVDPSLIVGRSCHSLDESEAARREGVDYILLGPVFPVRSKRGEPAVTVEELRAASAGVKTFALGGISLANLPQLCGSGLEGIAAITMYLMDRPLLPIVRAVKDC